jgi:hypothetical protein
MSRQNFRLFQECHNTTMPEVERGLNLISGADTVKAFDCIATEQGSSGSFVPGFPSLYGKSTECRYALRGEIIAGRLE